MALSSVPQLAHLYAETDKERAEWRGARLAGVGCKTACDPCGFCKIELVFVCLFEDRSHAYVQYLNQGRFAN